MSASNIIFSKGGGVSLTEALNLNIPIVIREKMITNEEINKDFFVKNKIALSLESIKEAKNIIEKLYDNPQILEEIRENQNRFARYNATKNVAEFAEVITKQEVI